MIRLKLEIGNWSGDLTQNGKVGGPCRGRALPNFTFRISNFKSRSAFTLIELLLVAFIMLLASAMAVPTFIRSYRSAKLRMSARTVVMTSRYARAMAVLQQKYVAVLFDRESGLVEMVGLDEQTGAADRNRFLDERSQPRADTPVEPEEGATFTVSSQVARRVAQGVRIESIELEQEAQDYEGITWVNYYPNGMCQAYTVVLRDERGQRATIEVDPMSGRAKVEYEK